ncbi:hypothetical protein UA08_03278 [Talaromyces atroroseus]|uniref:Uncharacterized protein n=1 Tax=Talaromyces atroroseus TaxID=1441469 RepID=A0A225AJ06_TALAT|nr:hypothetical protein UA08_03278 [Talaromyces atroroseus]OKL61441.1 hypothetical protein UA08_03278 [Talaromyces atroroseus]
MYFRIQSAFLVTLLVFLTGSVNALPKDTNPATTPAPRSDINHGEMRVMTQVSHPKPATRSTSWADSEAGDSKWTATATQTAATVTVTKTATSTASATTSATAVALDVLSTVSSLLNGLAGLFES